MIKVGFKILARTPVPKLPQSYIPLSVIHVKYDAILKNWAVPGRVRVWRNICSVLDFF